LAATGIITRRQIRTYILAIAVLLVLLVGLLLLLYLFSRPLVNVGAAKTDGYRHVLSIYGYEGDRLYRPVEVAVDKNGNIYVADSFKHRIVVFDSTGKFLTKFGEYGEGPTNLKFPSAVAVAPDGRVYVLCSAEDKIVAFRDGKPFWVVNVEKPLAATIKKDRLYIATARGVMIGDLDGRLLASFGVRGAGSGMVDMPNGISVDDKGNIYVADSMNYRIQAFNKDGKPLWTLGKGPKDRRKAIQSTERTYGLPTGMTIDENNILYFMDAFNGEIVMADNKGKELKKVGSWGHDDGQFYYPGGLTYAGNRNFIVADKFNDRVQVLYIPSPRPEVLTQIPRYSIPLAALLFVALLLAWLLRRRKQVVAADSSFIDRAIAENKLPMLRDGFKKILVTEEAYETYKDQTHDGVALGELLEVGKHDEGIAEKISEAFGIQDASAKILAICKRRRTRSTLLTEDESLKVSAEELEIQALDFDQLMALYQESEVQEEPA